MPSLGKSDHCSIEVLVWYSSNNSTDKFYLGYINADFDSMRKVFSDKFNTALKNFTDVNDQLRYFVKTLNIAKELFIPRKCFINSRNNIKLNKIAKSKSSKNQRFWKQYLTTNKGH